jgi:hypothetical protein
LAGRNRPNLDIVESEDVIPDFVREELPELNTMDRTKWRETLLAHARSIAEECDHRSKALSKVDTGFAAEILLARADYASGNHRSAQDRMESLMAGLTDASPSLARDSRLATLHYWWWKMESRDAESSWLASEKSAENHRSEAARIYRELAAKSPAREYKVRLSELE